MGKRKPIFMAMVGPCASGKSTYAQQYAAEDNVEVFSSDAYREKLYGDKHDQFHNDKVFKTLHNDIREALKAGKDCILDATNCTVKSRLSALEAVKDIDCVKIASVLTADAEQCIERNSRREEGDRLPDYVVYKYIAAFEPPLPWEGWDRIYIQGYDTDFAPRYQEKSVEIALSQMWVEQKTPHHKYSVRKHCIEAAERFKDKDPILYSAALFHDIGKALAPWDWTEKPEEGVRHYYHHGNIGAHLMLQNLECFKTETWDEIYEVLWLITYHMQARDWLKNEKSYKKWEARVSAKWMSDMKKLLKADQDACGISGAEAHAAINEKIKAGYYVEHQDEFVPEDIGEFPPPPEEPEKTEAPAEEKAENIENTEAAKAPVPEEQSQPPKKGTKITPELLRMMNSSMGMGGFGGLAGFPSMPPMPPMGGTSTEEVPKETVGNKTDE